jgi:hypothetical protein
MTKVLVKEVREEEKMWGLSCLRQKAEVVTLIAAIVVKWGLLELLLPLLLPLLLQDPLLCKGVAVGALLQHPHPRTPLSVRIDEHIAALTSCALPPDSPVSAA